MTQSLQVNHQKGVICLFCGQSTRLPAPAESRRLANPIESGLRASIIRCHLCGKEALYLSEEIVDFQDVPNTPNLRARAAGLP